MICTYGSLDLLAGSFLITDATDWGSPDFRTTAVANPYLDGDTLTGLTSGNRMIKLVIEIKANDKGSFAAAQALLAYQADRPRNTITYQPDNGLTVVFDTWRCRSITPVYDFHTDPANLRVFELLIPADPFTRAPMITQFAGTGTVTSVETFQSAGGYTVTQGTAHNADTAWYATGATASLLIDPVGVSPNWSVTVAASGTADMSARFAEVMMSIAYVNISGTNVLTGDLYLILSNSGTGLAPTSTRLQVADIYEGDSSPSSPRGAFASYAFDLERICASSLRGTGTTWSLQFACYSPAEPYIRFNFLQTRALGQSVTSAPSGVCRFTMPGSYRTPVNLQLAGIGGYALGDVLLARWPGYDAAFDPFGAGTGTFTASKFGGQYTILCAVANSWSSGVATSVTATITITQNGHSQIVYAYINGEDIDNRSLLRLGGSGRRFIALDIVALPLFDVSDVNTTSTFTVSVSFSAYLTTTIGPILIPSGQEVELIQTCVTNDGGTTQYDTLFLQTAPQDRFTRVMRGTSAATAVGVYPPPLGQGVMNFAAGDNTLVVVATGATNGVAVSGWAYPRFLTERDV